MKPLEDFTSDQLRAIREIDPAFSGQEWKGNGCPDFSDHAFKVNGDPNFKLPGMKGNDNNRHDQALLVRHLMSKGVDDKTIAGLLKTHVLHHVEKGELAQLVPRAIHDASRHTGGSADIRALAKAAGGAVGTFLGAVFIPNSMDAAQTGRGHGSAAFKDFGAMGDPGFLEPLADAERYARDHDIMGSIETFLTRGTVTKPEPLR